MDNNLTKNLRALTKILNAVDENSLTPDEFMNAFRMVMDYVKRMEANNTAQLRDILEQVQDARTKLQEMATEERDETRTTLEGHLAQLENRAEEMLALMDARLAEIRNGEDGKDADEELVVERAVVRVKEEISIPTAEDVLNDVTALGERVRDSLELLEGEDRLKATAIQGLEELISRVGQMGTVVEAIRGAANTPTPMNRPLHEATTMNGILDYVTLNEAVGAGGTAVIVRYQGQTLDMTTHYTVDGNKITFTFTPDADTVISVTYWAW